MAGTRRQEAESHDIRRILLIDDDRALCSLMAEFFSPFRFGIDSVHDGASGLARALEGAYDLAILDVMLPELDGLDVLAQLRRRSPMPVILLTALTEYQNRIAGFEAGADDYLCKPFSPDELLVRVRAVLRRACKDYRPEDLAIRLGDLTIHPKSQEVWDRTRRIDVTSTEFHILDILMRSQGQIVSRDRITTLLHQRRAGPFERTIDVHVCHLRKKLEGNSRISIRAIRGVGYLMALGGRGDR